MRIGKLELEGNVFLAPMAGITDLSFRRISKMHGACLTYSEMVSAKGMYYNSRNTNALLSLNGEKPPIGVQIFGSEPDIIAEMVKRLNETDFDLIDINMGCPAPKIVKNGEGSALMKNPALIAKIVEAAAKAAQKPLTIKIRKGFNNESINAVEVAKIAEQSGASAVTVHGRTREQYYSGTADWSIIAEVKSAVSIPIIANGDIKSAEDAKNCLELTGADAVMIGRAACGNPWIFDECCQFLKNGSLPQKPSIFEKIETARLHLTMLAEEKGEFTAVREFRRHFSYYAKGIAGASRLREKAVACQSIQEMDELLKMLP